MLLWCAPAAAVPLAVCMAADNAPLSWQSGRVVRGLDVRIANVLTHAVNALLSAGLCDVASGYALLASDPGPPARPTSRSPGCPGAKRLREWSFVPLGTLVASRAHLAVSLGLLQRAGSAPLVRLGDLGDRRLGVVSGTLASAVALSWKQGVLHPKVVSLSLRGDALADGRWQPGALGGRRRCELVGTGRARCVARAQPG